MKFLKFLLSEMIKNKFFFIFPILVFLLCISFKTSEFTCRFLSFATFFYTSFFFLYSVYLWRNKGIKPEDKIINLEVSEETMKLYFGYKKYDKNKKNGCLNCNHCINKDN